MLKNGDKVYKKTFDIVGEDVMPIGVWSGPLNDMATDGFYREFQELGINLFIAQPSFEENRESLYKHLKLAEKYNMASFVPYSDKYLPITKKQVCSAYEDLSNYKSFVGLTYRDELRYGEIIKDYIPIIKEFKKTKYSEKYGYFFNALPFWAKVFGKDFVSNSYRKYLNLYASKKALDCGFISADIYPFVGEDELLVHNYFYQLAIMRDVANIKKVPFFIFVQCGSISERTLSLDTSSYSAFCWNVNTALAYGAKGILYFTLTYSNYGSGGWDDIYQKTKDVQLANNTADGTNSAIYNRYNNLTHNRWYDYVVKLNKHIKAIDEILMNSYSFGVIAYGNSPYEVVKKGRISGTKWRKLKDVYSNGDILIGCFVQNKNTVLYVVDNSYKQGVGDNLSLTLKKEYNYTIIQDGIKTSNKSNHIELILNKGEGVLVIIE